MKKSLIALAVLATAATTAQAASSVTMYGRLDIGYEKTGSKAWTQEQNANRGNTRLGFKGNEDLGNGMAATFQLEGRFEGDTGEKNAKRAFFDRESTVGLKGSFGHVRLGRSISAMEQGVSFVDVGRRNSAADTYYSVTRHSNALFYNYSAGAFQIGADIATKGGYNDSPLVAGEAVVGSKVAYGAFAKYTANGLEVGIAHQADKANSLNATAAITNLNRETAIGLSYNIKPVTFGVIYADGRGLGSVAANKLKTRVMGAYLSAAVTPNDTVNFVYREMRAKNLTGANVLVDSKKTTRYALGYIHDLSKRTSVYADIARVKTTTAVPAAPTSVKATSFDVAVRHNF